ncbi:CoA transferase [Variovorax dokdonensis]|uniref:CoA transferase n=2 Tax=Variovorax dokdonensis TaxID=344883 RepID=A0ABT7NAS7_9BURK|nr:CoA transferase [Variovorax dokdonensis]MDM0045036.1 CoA transferase [Variovorax dokdonensis]
MLAPKTQGPLAGLVVIDLTRVLAGPYCTMTLGDLGARVVKVEMPGQGDDARHIGPFVEGADGEQTSGYFFSVNRNKESIALDLKLDRDKAVLEKLLDSADVLVENYSPGTMDRLGYGWDMLHARWPRLILASISGFGQTGPYRTLPAYDMVVQAMGGVLSLTGDAPNRPTRVGVSIGDIAAGMFGVIGIQAALLERARSHEGKHVDVAMLDSQVALLENALVRYQVDGVVPGPIGSRHPSITPFGVFRTGEGHIVLAAGNDRLFTRLLDILGLERLSTDPRFIDNAARCAHPDELRLEIELALAAKSTPEWLKIFTAAGVPCGPMNDVAAVMKDPQVRARHMLMELPVSNDRSLTIAGSPIKFQGEILGDAQPAPRLDQHRDALLTELGLL